MGTLRLFSIIFLTVIAGADLYLIGTSQEKKRIWTKPFIIPLIIFIYSQYAKQINYSLVMALAFSFFGDFFLLFSEKKIFFQTGLFSFLMSHILYIYTFTGTISLSNVPPIRYLVLIIPYLIYILVFLKILKPYLENYLIPVILYTITIAGMSYASLLRFWTTTGFYFWLPFIGSLFFIISDSLLAIRNFRYGQKKGWITVMLSYILGQLFIVMGFMG
ncbi:MAG TPA: lysoplasmalogenase [Atribacterota bacterium]|nr:lysoplasmalogenase [Atribacterota bacterium]